MTDTSLTVSPGALRSLLRVLLAESVVHPTDESLREEIASVKKYTSGGYEHAVTAKRIHLEPGDTFTLGALDAHDAPSPALSELVGVSHQLPRFANDPMRDLNLLADAEAVEAVAEFTALLGILSEGLTAISRTAQQLSTYFAAAQAASTQKA